MSNASDSTPRLSAVSKATRFLCLLAQPALARKLGTLSTEGYLAQTGWIRSVVDGLVVDAQGEPLPWATLPFIDFARPRLRPELTVFEYGSGASTLFYAARVRAVLAVEHDEGFANALRPQLPSHVRVLVRAPDSTGYASAIAECAVPPEFVSVDGVDRVSCVQTALNHLAPNGVLVLDDAERPEYERAHKALAATGFRSVEFWGLAPGRVERKCTTVFYRSGNVLGL